jgi:Zn-dependent peptidase ImmA (M78 family)
MMAKISSSKLPMSRLVELFVQRCGVPANTPEEVIRTLANRLSAYALDRGDLHTLLPMRHIDQDVALVRDLACDGAIEPKGSTYRDGFRMLLRHGQPGRRLRFTKAHEICHTFFYEFVPELKFCNHTVDFLEERLCNIGAEELLMPIARVNAEAASMPVSISSLESLARRFDVSLSAMLLRLRQAGLWHCELAYWHRMVDGSFVLAQKSGGRKADWQIDSSILQDAWEARGTKTESGVTFIYYERNKISAADWVYYQARRQGNLVLTLWGHRKLSRREKIPPLLRQFQMKGGRDS